MVLLIIPKLQDNKDTKILDDSLYDHSYDGHPSHLSIFGIPKTMPNVPMFLQKQIKSFNITKSMIPPK